MCRLSVGGMCSEAHQSGKIVMLWLHHLAGEDLEAGKKGRFPFRLSQINDQ